MSTLSDFKDMLVVGNVYEVENHVYPELSGQRVLLRKQTARAVWTLPADHPKYSPDDGSWFDFPKAANVRREGDSFIVDRDPEWGDSGPFFTVKPLDNVREGA